MDFSVQELKKLRLARKFISKESCLRNLYIMESSLKSFFNYVRFGEINSSNFAEIQQHLINCEVGVLRETKSFLKDRKKELSLQDKRNLIDRINEIKALYNKMILPYEKLKNDIDNLIRSLDFLKTNIDEKRDLWNKVDETYDRVVNCIMPRHDDSDRRENLFVFVERALVYFIDSMRIEANSSVSLLDSIDTALKDLASYGFRDDELQMAYKEIEGYIKNSLNRLKNLNGSYPSYYDNNPYASFTQEGFRQELRKFKSIMNTKIFECLSLNAVDVILIVLLDHFLKAPYCSEEIYRAAIMPLLTANLYFYEKVDACLSREETENLQISDTLENYNRLRDEYLNNHTDKQLKIGSI